LALGEEDETLAANRTIHIRGVGCAFAQDLHQESLSFVPVEFQTQQGSELRARDRMKRSQRGARARKAKGEFPLFC
jgi:hypothetical protein